MHISFTLFIFLHIYLKASKERKEREGKEVVKNGKMLGRLKNEEAGREA